jgi:alkylation response protein AidB-like acyl-CoA dehydrogenase
MLELTAKTEPGRRLVALAERMAGELAEHAGAHDRDGTYPYESVHALRDAGYLAAPVPERYGGMGVTSVHDLLVAAARLARADASVAIGANMHVVVLRNVVRRWEMALARGSERRAGAWVATMEAVARDGEVIATAVSELGQDLTRPATVAMRTENGWQIDGRKAFCTMSPAATILYTAVTFHGEDGSERYGYARVPADAPGVVVHDDWDALGMRASGSHSVSFSDVELPESALRGGFASGDPIPYMEANLTAGLFHASASLGIAEAALQTAAQGLRAHADGRARSLLAEAAVELTACRAALARAGALIDDHYAEHPTDDGGPERLTALFTESQTAKVFISEAAVRVVDRALALSGGAGYRSGHPLARAYRDVRAGSFMHPLGANRAYELVADVALGRLPVLH